MLVTRQLTKDTKKMRIEQGTYKAKDLGYDAFMQRRFKEPSSSMQRGDTAGGDLMGLYPRPNVNWENGQGTFDARYLALSGGTLTGNLETQLLKIKLFSQAGEPTASDIGTSQIAFWIDTDDSSLHLCFNHAGTIKTVALT